MKLLLQSTCAALLFAAAAHAEDSGWNLRLGGTVRQFEDITLNIPTGSAANGAGGPFGVQQYSQLPTLADGTKVSVIYPGAIDADEDAKGLSLQASTPISGDDRWTLSFLVGAQYLTMDTSNSAATGASFSQSVFTVGGNPGTVLPAGPGDGPNALPAGYSSRVDLDASLVIIDLGLRAATSTGSFDMFVAAGPSLVFGSIDAGYTAAWTPVPGEPSDTGAAAGRDDSTSVGIAAFGAAGVTFHVTDSVVIGAEYRYDIGGDLSNDIADFSLDAQSFTLFIAIEFR